MVVKYKRKSFKVGDFVLNGKYEILKVIHTSGMANVYLVLDKNLNKQWCLKEIKKSEAGKNMLEYRSLIQEANILKSLNHSNIPRIVTMEEDGDSIFIVMDYVQGVSIKSWIAVNGVVSQSIAVKLMKQVCTVLIYLHNRENPIFLRDLKSDNIMIQEDGNIKVLDFGISLVLKDKNMVIEEPLGTKGFASPEQGKKGSRCDLRSDIYALGKTLYHMLTGLNPSLIEGKPRPIREVNSSLSMGLEVIIDKCTKDNPDDRYQTVEEVLYALSNFNKLDIAYTNKVKKKIKIVAGLLVGSVVSLGGSFIALGLHKSQIGNMYSKAVEVANQTGRTSDYLKAIAYKPMELEPYKGLIQSLKVDGVFTKEEEVSLLELINPNLADIKNGKTYGELAYDIGKLYWFYYEGEDGEIVSTKWFKEAIDRDYNKQESKIYYDLGSFKRDISMSIAESSDAGMYEEYWYNLMEAKKYVSGDIMELFLYRSIIDAISSYAYRFNTDGIPKESLIVAADDIISFLEVYTPVSDKSNELVNSLKNSIVSIKDKIELAYK